MRNIAESVFREIQMLDSLKLPVLIAIDGRCAAGKTTLAAHLQKICGCNVLHMDHFFLRPDMRTKARLKEPGGNVDYERFLDEVLMPLARGLAFSYRPYDCRKQGLAEPVYINPRPVGIIEGAYSCHPSFADYYDLKVFLSVSPSEQLLRIKQRNGEEGAAAFTERWIPLEEGYFSACNVRERCELCFETGASP